MKQGALPMQMIEELLENDFILGAKLPNIRPGSLDLSLSDEVYRVKGAFLPSPGESVRDSFKRVGGVRLTGEKVLLEKDCCYAVRLQESVKSFPQNVYAYCNPKSSSGRVDLHVRLLVDGCSRYDAVDRGYSGPLWLLIVPKTFSVIISPGLTLNQMRFFNADTRLDETRLEMRFHNLLFESEGKMIEYSKQMHSDKDGSILLSLGLQFDRPGFEAIGNREPLDLSLKGHYDPKCFFREVSVFENSLTLTSGTFYILSTKEYVRVPENMACEMRPMDERSGDLRSHYAGFIDPGWGTGHDGNGRGKTLTLEVRSFDSGIIVREGQPIAKIRYEDLCEKPTNSYEEMSPTYGVQLGPKLGKYFSEWK